MEKNDEVYKIIIMHCIMDGELLHDSTALFETVGIVLL